MKKLLCLVMLIIFAVLPCANLQAVSINSIWFGDVNGADLTQMDVSPGATFNVYIWAKSDVETFSFEACVGFDKATTSGQVDPSTLLDKKIALATGSVNTDAIWGSNIATYYDAEIVKSLCGFKGTGTTPRPYGVDLCRARITLTGYAPPITNKILLATIKLKNNMATAGNNYNISIYDFGSKDSQTSHILAPTGNQSETIYRTSDTLTIRTAISNRLLGAVDLQNYNGNKTIVPVNIDFIKNNSIVKTSVINLDQNGLFQVDGILSDTYDVKIKASHWLVKKTTNVVISGDKNIGIVSLINGDTVENNEVDWDDYNALVDAFGSLPGDANWNLNADLDGTGEVDWDDFNIVVNNFGAVGD